MMVDSISECGICLDFLLIPKLLNCFHYFCQCCIESIQQSKAVICPTCGEKTTCSTVAELQYHPLYIHNANSTTKDPICVVCSGLATRCCVSCNEEYCEGCSITHSKMKISKDHTLKPIESHHKLLTCGEHVLQNLDYYCYNCCKLLCAACVNEGTLHSDHRIINCKMAAEDFKRKISDKVIPNLQNSVDKRNESLQKLKVTLKQEDCKLGSLKTKIHNHSRLLITMIENKEKALFAEADKAFGPNRLCINNHIGEVTAMINKITTFEKICCTFNDTLSDNGLLQIKSLLETRHDNLLESASESYPSLNLDHIDCLFQSSFQDKLMKMEGFGEISVVEGHSRASDGAALWETKFQAPLYVTKTGDNSLLVIDSVCQANKQKVRVKEVTVLGEVKRGVWAFSRNCTETEPTVQPILHSSNNKMIVGLGHNIIIKEVNKSYKFGTEGEFPGQLRAISGLTLSSIGNILVSDNKLNRINMFTPEGGFVLCFGTSSKKVRFQAAPHSLSCPGGVAVDAQDNVYVADSGNHRIALFNHEGCYMKSIGSRGSLPGQFMDPVDIQLNTDTDILAVLDRGNKRVQFLDVDSESERVVEILQLDTLPGLCKHVTWLPGGESAGAGLTGDVVLVGDDGQVYRYKIGTD